MREVLTIMILCQVLLTINSQSKKNGVFILNESNLENFKKNNQLSLILFYTESSESKQTKFELYSAMRYINRISENRPIIAKYKIKDPKENEKFGLGRLPVFMYYVEDQVSNLGIMNDKDIISLFQKTEKTVIPVETEEEIQYLTEDKPNYSIFAFWIGPVNTKEFEKFFSYSRSSKSILCFACKSEYCIKAFGLNSILIKKNFNPTKDIIIKDISDLKEEEIKEYIESNSTGYVMDFTPIFIDASMLKRKLAVIVFRSDNSNLKREYEKILQNAAKKFPEISFHASDIDSSEDSTKLAKYFQITDKKLLPRIALYDMRSGDFHTYLFPQTEKFNKKNLKAFITNFYKGNLARELLSEDLHDAEYKHREEVKKLGLTETNVKILVRDNFEAEVLSNSKDVMINFYTSWCEHCHELMPFYENFAQYMSINPDLILAKIDMSKNTVDGTKVSEFPTFKLYPAYKKDEPIEYPGNAIHAEFAEFIKKNSNTTITVPQIVYDKSDDL